MTARGDLNFYFLTVDNKTTCGAGKMGNLAIPISNNGLRSEKKNERYEKAATEEQGERNLLSAVEPTRIGHH